MSSLRAFRNTSFSKKGLVTAQRDIYDLSPNVFISLSWLLTNRFIQRYVFLAEKGIENLLIIVKYKELKI